MSLEVTHAEGKRGRFRWTARYTGSMKEVAAVAPINGYDSKDASVAAFDRLYHEMRRDLVAEVTDLHTKLHESEQLRKGAAWKRLLITALCAGVALAAGGMWL